MNRHIEFLSTHIALQKETEILRKSNATVSNQG